MSNGKDDDEIPTPQRPPSPPLHTTFTVRGIHAPTFSAFRPRDIKISSPHSMTHVAWSCDGKRLGATGIDKSIRVWQPEHSLELRSATSYNTHTDDLDYFAWNPTHADLFCSSSQRDRRIVFWDARQSKPTHTINLKYTPVQLVYSPDASTILSVSSLYKLFILTYGKDGEDSPEQWRVRPSPEPLLPITTVLFNHTGDAFITAHTADANLRAIRYPSITSATSFAAHVGGCIATAFDPRGQYLASGGHDSIVNLFDTSDWICTRTITACDNSIHALSFSHDGEFIAIANSGAYIDICATETGMPMHRIPAPGPAQAVSWHPSQPLVAYCGQTKSKEGGPAPLAYVSVFGPGI